MLVVPHLPTFIKVHDYGKKYWNFWNRQFLHKIDFCETHFLHFKRKLYFWPNATLWLNMAKRAKELRLGSIRLIVLESAHICTWNYITLLPNSQLTFQMEIRFLTKSVSFCPKNASLLPKSGQNGKLLREGSIQLTFLESAHVFT